MAFAAARMILKDKRRKPSREDYPPRNRSKARSKQSDGPGLLPSGRPGCSSSRSPVPSPKPPPLGKSGVPKPGGVGGGNGASQQTTKGSSNQQQQGGGANKAVNKSQSSVNVRNNKKNKKGQRHNQHDLAVTIDLLEYGLTEDQVADFKEAFMLIDKDEDGMISVSEVGVVMRSLGQRSTDKEIKTLVREVSNDNLRTTVEFNEFLQVMSKKMRNDGTEEELLEAFKVFDKLGEGWILSTDLRDIMKHLGEKLSDPEVDDMLREADGDGKGRIFYKEFVALLAK